MDKMALLDIELTMLGKTAVRKSSRRVAEPRSVTCIVDNPETFLSFFAFF